MAIISPLKKIFNWQTASEKIPYRVYTALLTQTGTDAPVAIVLENTLGNVVWTRDNLGIYVGTSSGSFTENKTIIPPFDPVGYTILPIWNSSVADIYYSFYRNSVNEVKLSIFDSTGGQVELSSISDFSPLIEIRVYN